MKSTLTSALIATILAIGAIALFYVGGDANAATLELRQDSLLPLASMAMIGLNTDANAVAEIKKLIEGQGAAWEQFKSKNDERLKALSDGNKARAAELDEQLAKINAELKSISDQAKQIEIKQNRPKLAGSEEDLEREVKSFNGAMFSHYTRLSRQAPAPIAVDAYVAYKSAYMNLLRKGRDQLTVDEIKAVQIGVDPDGGYLAPVQLEGGIDRVAAKASAMRQIARVITIGASSYKRIVTTSGAAAGGWVGETATPSESATPGLSELEFVPGTVYAEPRATSDSLEDIVLDVEAWLAEEIGITLADQESQAFIDGNGVKKPRGFLSYDMVANASYAWGKIGFIVSGAAADFAASNPSDKLVDLQHALKRNYRSNAQWIMNDATLGAVRKFKDGQGIYLWAPSGLQGGIVGQLLGYPVNTDDYMPDLGANAFPVAFGDFNRGYLIVDRRGITILRDPYTAKPYVKFYTTKRVGGGVQNFEAIKVLKCST